MRLDEWQRYIDSEFLEAKSGKRISVAEPAAQSDEPPIPEDTHRTDGATAPSAPGASETLPPQPAEVSISAVVALQATEAVQTEPAQPLLPALDRPSDAIVGRQSQRRRRAAPAREADTTDAVAPFAEYISARLAADGPAASPGREVEARQDDDTDSVVASAGDAVVIESASNVPSSDSADTAAARPLVPSDQASGLLGSAFGVSPSLAGTSPQSPREALLDRMYDPMLSLEEVATLLEVTPAIVRGAARSGALKSCEPTRRIARSEGTNPRESNRRQFRLSDILAFAAAGDLKLEV